MKMEPKDENYIVDLNRQKELKKIMMIEKVKLAQKLFSKNISIRNCVRELQLSQKKVRRMRKQYQNLGMILPEEAKMNKKQKHSKKSIQIQKIKQLIKQIIKENCSITLQGIQTELKKLNILRKTTSICYYLKQIKYSRKKIKQIPIERNSKQKILFRQKYCQMISEFPINNLIFLDQTYFNQNTNSKFGWAPKGQQPFRHVSLQKRKCVTLLAAISIRGFEAIKLVKGPLNHKHICEFFQHYLDHLQVHEVVVLDNARIHHAAEVKQKMYELGRQVRYLPPYTPQLNPIQNVFNSIKSTFLRQRQYNQMSNEQIIQLVRQILQRFQGKSFYNYFRNYEMWVKKGIQCEIFV